MLSHWSIVDLMLIQLCLPYRLLPFQATYMYITFFLMLFREEEKVFCVNLFKQNNLTICKRKVYTGFPFIQTYWQIIYMFMCLNIQLSISSESLVAMFTNNFTVYENYMHISCLYYQIIKINRINTANIYKLKI